MKTEIISDGKHFLSGVDSVEFNVGWDGEDTVNGIILCIDGKNYGCFVNPDDGYRSYGSFFETEEAPKNTFSPQEVIVKNIHEDSQDDNGWPTIYDILVISNSEEDVILEVGTNHSDEYYPYGIFRWYPENLPINKKQ